MSQPLPPHAKARPSAILATLGSRSFASCTAVRVPGKVAWCNLELARQLGFAAHEEGLLDERLEQQLVAAFSLRLLGKRERPKGRPSLELHADRYGGFGLGRCKGSGRGAFHPFGDYFVKGIGLTPLFGQVPGDFLHSHGGMHLWHGVFEAALAEVGHNLFAEEPARILCVIDQGEHTVFPDGDELPRGVVVRVGNQLRPAHLLPRRRAGDRDKLELFIDITRRTGQLVEQPRSPGGADLPDVRATLLRVLDDHMRAGASQTRWRLPHCSVTASNLQVDAGLLDIAQTRANPRCTPLGVDYVMNRHNIPRTDYLDRAVALYDMVNAVRASIPAARRKAVGDAPIDIQAEIDERYLQHMRRQLLSATGLKRSVVERLCVEHPEPTRALVDTLIAFSELRNPASVRKTVQYDERAAVVDVMSLLGSFAPVFFGEPAVRHRAAIRRLLRPVYMGNPNVVAKKRAAVTALIGRFARDYAAVMQAALRHAVEHHGSGPAMRASIIARSAFESRPMDRLYFPRKKPIFTRAVAEYRVAGDRNGLRKLVQSTIAASVRNVDALLHQGASRALADGGLELQIRAIQGLRCSVRAWERRQRRELAVSVALQRVAGGWRVALPGFEQVPAGRVAALRWCYTTDGWVTSHVARGSVDERGARLELHGLRFSGPYGELCGYFVDPRNPEVRLDDAGDPFAGYVFAIPDAMELASLRPQAAARRGR
jgi:hypothetical protein